MPAAPPSAAEAMSRAESLLADPDADAGVLPVACRVALVRAAGGGLEVRFEVTVPFDPEEPPAGPLRVTLLAGTIEGDVASAQRTVEVGAGPVEPGAEDELALPGAFVYRDALEVSDDLHGAVAVVEDLGSAAGSGGLLWGGATARLTAELPAPSGGAASAGASAREGDSIREGVPGAPPAAGALPPAPTPPPPPPATFRLPPPRGGGASAEPPGGQVIALLPPRERPATGRTRFQTLITTDLIGRVDFFLDGAPAGSDDRAPFSVTLDLGPEPRPHTVRAVAYERSGEVLGEHTLEINRGAGTPFAVAVTALTPTGGGDGAGSFEMEATVSIPAGRALERVEVYRNDELLTRLAAPPFRATVAGAAGPSDFVRVVAFLDDGTTAEDVRFLTGEVAGERVEVNLVELFAVVTGEDGQPVEGLTAEDFEILVDGRPRPVERFQRADEVPLDLALAVDTSESMWPLMIDTQQAASRFLVNTLIPGDRAALVAFSNRPRLVAGPTGDVSALLQSFVRLQAGGATALYDSIVFSLVQLREGAGGGDDRRAVVLLTDGQDYGSRFRPRRVIDDARAQGTPVYVISLAGLYNERGSVRKPDLETIVSHTGGRIYYISDVAELASAYDQINRELRTQYILAFGTERPLTESELRSIRLRMRRPGLEARVAVEPAR
jgi:Ca-activated chloride channel family protein